MNTVSGIGHIYVLKPSLGDTDSQYIYIYIYMGS